MSGESNSRDREHLIAAIEQIKMVADECLRRVRNGSRPQNPRIRRARTPQPRTSQIDLDKPIRPFIKSYARGLSGPKKFALVLGWLCKGDLKREVELKEVEKCWNNMTSLLEMRFNRFFPARAKENDWVDSKKKGFYNLRPTWKDATKV